MAIGSPLGHDFDRTVTAGVISALNGRSGFPARAGTDFAGDQTDAAINRVIAEAQLAATGVVIGINSVKIASAEVEGMGFAIPINDAKPIIQQLVPRL